MRVYVVFILIFFFSFHQQHQQLRQQRQMIVLIHSISQQWKSKWWNNFNVTWRKSNDSNLDFCFHFKNEPFCFFHHYSTLFTAFIDYHLVSWLINVYGFTLPFVKPFQTDFQFITRKKRGKNSWKFIIDFPGKPFHWWNHLALHSSPSSLVSCILSPEVKQKKVKCCLTSINLHLIISQKRWNFCPLDRLSMLK